MISSPFQGLIVDLETGKYIDFLSFDEPSLNESGRWESQRIYGRAGTKRPYVYTEDQVWSMTIYLWASISQYDGGDAEQARERWNFLRSFQYPDYDGQAVREPHRVHLRLGSTIDDPGIIEGMRSNLKFPLDRRLGLFFGYECSFNFVVMPETPPSYKDFIGTRFNYPWSGGEGGTPA